jgi:hypothetical protein
MGPSISDAMPASCGSGVLGRGVALKKEARVMWETNWTVRSA